METTISIIVPVYNIIEYLPRCVESLRKQTYDKIEILLVDDGSTDGTSALCDVLAAEDVRIRVFHKQNGGSSSARNLGIQEATGEYLGFVDSDDYVEPDMYERLLQAIETTHLPIAQTGRDEIDPEGKKLPNICEPVTERQEIPAKEFLRELLMHRGDCSFCTKLVRRDLFEEEGFPVGVLNEDFHLLVKLLTDAADPVRRFLALSAFPDSLTMYFTARTAIPESRPDFPESTQTMWTMRIWCRSWWRIPGRRMRNLQRLAFRFASSRDWITCCIFPQNR